MAQNKKARHEYFIEEEYETGIELTGTEVKSVRKGKVNLKESYCEIVAGELILHGCHISAYEQGNIFNADPLRSRKLLMHKAEINRLLGKVKEQGYTLVPLDMHFKGQYAKLLIALAKGKKLYDKRDTAAALSAKRQMERALKEKNMGA
ncbi:MAG: SsrA-binding protein SmpB [Clostridia bacterium]|nr:SsrA-binding protein SmpB [Clostridia bacterium]